MNQQQAAQYVQGLLNQETSHYRGTSVYVKNCIVYDFGWYFDYGVRGEMLCGGPDHGIFVSTEGFSYALHYVGFPWDTGIGTHMSGDTVTLTNNVWHPTKYAARYFKKKLKAWKAIQANNNILLNKNFNSPNGYQIEDACKFLKLDLCMTRDKALEWISINSGCNINFMDPGYNSEAFRKVTKVWTDLINTGLLDENWQSYYDKAIV